MATSLTEPQSGELVRASHVAPIAGLINGTANSDNIPAAFINHTSTTVYSLRARNQSTSSSAPIFKASYNTGGSETTVLDVTAAGIKGGKFFDKGGELFNVKSFETTANTVGVNSNTSADTIAIEAAIAALKAQSLAQFGIGADGRLVRLHFPAGTYNVFRTIDLSGLVGIAITGDGVQSTRFGLATGSGAEAGTAAYWSVKPMMDITGGNFLRLMNFSIQPGNSGASDPIPEVGLLMAGNAAFTNWIGSSIPANVANANYIDTVRVSGAFLVASHCNFACPSSVYIRCDFNREKSNNLPTYPNGQNGNQAALLLTRDNYGSSGNPLVHAGGAVGLISSSADGVSCSDLTFIDTEVHDGCNGGTGSCTCPAVWLDECYDVRFYGGNFSGHSNAFGYVRMSVGRANGSVEELGCQRILFDSVFWYPAEGGGSYCEYGIVVTGNVADNAAVVRSHVEPFTDDVTTISIVASDVTLRNSQVTLTTSGALATGRRSDGLTTGPPAVYFIRWHVENMVTKDDDSPVFHLNDNYAVLTGASTVAHVKDAYWECHGLDINTNGGTWTGAPPIRPGTITSTTVSHGDYEIQGGGTVSLTDNDTGYYGMGSASLTETDIAPVRISQACRVFNLRVSTGTPPGGAISLTFFLRKASPATGHSFANTTLTNTIATTSVIGADTTHFVDLAAGDEINVSVSNPNTGATTAWCTWSLSAIPI